MVKKGEEKSGIIKRADAGAAAKACKVLVESNYSGPRPYIRILNTSCSFPPLTRLKMLICGEGSPIRILMYENQSLLRASTTIR